MRISIHKNDSGYGAHNYARSIGKKPSIKFNGEIQTSCITADSDAGMVVRLVQPLCFDAARQAFVDEVCHGRVEIEFHDEYVL